MAQRSGFFLLMAPERVSKHSKQDIIRCRVAGSSNKSGTVGFVALRTAFQLLVLAVFFYIVND